MDTCCFHCTISHLIKLFRVTRPKISTTKLIRSGSAQIKKWCIYSLFSVLPLFRRFSVQVQSDYSGSHEYYWLNGYFVSVTFVILISPKKWLMIVHLPSRMFDLLEAKLVLESTSGDRDCKRIRVSGHLYQTAIEDDWRQNVRIKAHCAKCPILTLETIFLHCRHFTFAHFQRWRNRTLGSSWSRYARG